MEWYVKKLLQMILYIIAMIIIFSCEGNDEKNAKKSKGVNICDNSSNDGYRTIIQDEKIREYILYVPTNYDPNTPTPLVINFHGFGDCASDYSKVVGDYYGLSLIADSSNFLVAYPQGLVRGKGGSEWNPEDNGLRNIHESDIFFTEELINDISVEYNINLSKIYAVGYSNGGMMSYGLACTRGNVIAAIGIMSGIMLPGTCDASEQISVIHFHGIADEVLPYDGNEYFQSVFDVIKFWLNHNNIPISNLITTEFNGGDVARDKYRNRNASVVLYTIHNEYGKPGGHVWFSDQIGGKNPNQILWDFLSSFTVED